jgi:1-aminocyclopropane-1-carboxylate deaminase/D-cysteine desulfhydrase-like pyridoxal-dependent ACC family enzyme
VEADYQRFVPAYPRVRLATLPTPLERAERLEDALRGEGCAQVPRLYLKRDDLLSLGMGGNKVRNLEFSIGQALDDGATDIVTAGRPQSNHCRLTAAACARNGLRAHLVVTGSRPHNLTGSLLLDEMLGAKIYFTGSDDRALRAYWVEVVAGSMAQFGRTSYVLPVGGSDARGALGHALAALELVQQLKGIGEPLSAIALATATGGTQAGMLAGLRKLGVNTQVHGFAVAKHAEELRADVFALASEVAADIRGPSIAEGDVLLDGAMLGAGYGVPSAAGVAAAELLARSHGIFADPVYTAKALAGLLTMVRNGRFASSETVVFIHTGGTPALFADLPATSV